MCVCVCVGGGGGAGPRMFASASRLPGLLWLVTVRDYVSYHCAILRVRKQMFAVNSCDKSKWNLEW